MTSRPRSALAALAVVLVEWSGPSAQPKVDLNDGPAAPRKNVAPATRVPGSPVTVDKGPDPWYTVFGTGEVVGFIEPCG